MQEKYLIWSIEHNAWWKPREWGYTSLRKEAGIYSKEKALQIVEKANIGNHDIPNEAMILIEDEENDGPISNCCSARCDEDIQMCMDCKEHCSCK